MRTLFLGSYGFGNLGDELCLLDSLRKFKTDDAWAFSHDPSFTSRATGLCNFIKDREEIQSLNPERVVLGGGGVGFWPSLRDSMHWLWDGMRFCSSELHIHNIGVATIHNDEWFRDDIVKQVFGHLSSFSVRDHVSRWLVREWGFGLDPFITYYPEHNLAAEPFHIPEIEGKLVGFSITGQPAMLAALESNRDRIRDYIKNLGEFRAIPVISTVQAVATEDDMIGFNTFSELFLNKNQIAFDETLDKDWWADHMTPLRLKYLIAKLDLLISQRKHNVIHALGTRTKFTGIFPDEDDSILRIMFSMRHLVPDGSSFLALDTGRYNNDKQPSGGV